MKFILWCIELLGRVLPPALAKDEPRAPVLVVDDEPSSRDLVEEYVRRCGYKAVKCATADDAKSELAQQVFGTALLDIRLIGEGGLRLERFIHKNYPKTRVAFVTGFPGDLQQLPPGKALILIVKGVDGQSLYEAVEDVLSMNGNGKSSVNRVAAAIYTQLLAALLLGIGLSEIGFVRWLQQLFKTSP